MRRKSSALQHLVALPVSLLGASTFPLALLLRILGLSAVATRLSDEVLAALGVVRTGNVEASHAQLRTQLRERTLLLKQQLASSEAARRALERESGKLRAAQRDAGVACAVSGALLHALYASLAAAALAFAALVERPHQSIEARLECVLHFPALTLRSASWSLSYWFLQRWSSCCRQGTAGRSPAWLSLRFTPA